MKKNADWDDVVPLWEHGRPAGTLRKYRPVVRHFRNFIQQVPLKDVTLEMLQDYMNLQRKLKPATINWKMSSLSSLLDFSHRLGVLPQNPATMLRLPKVPDELAKRILPVADIQKIIEGEPDKRNKIMI